MSLSARKTWTTSFTESFDGLVEFALENGAGTLIPFRMLLYVAHLPGVPMSGIFSKAAAQVCEVRDLDEVLRLFLPAAVTAMTREDAVEMGERRLGGNPIAWKLFSNEQTPCSILLLSIGHSMNNPWYIWYISK